MPVGDRPTIKSLLVEGKTVDEVMAQLGVKRHSVHSVRCQEALPRINGKRTHEKDVECLAMLREGNGLREIARTLHISQATVRVIRVDNGLPIAPRDAMVIPDLGRCGCGLSLPCTCTGPMSAVEYMGRTDAPIAHSTGNHFG